MSYTEFCPPNWALILLEQDYNALEHFDEDMFEWQKRAIRRSLREGRPVMIEEGVTDLDNSVITLTMGEQPGPASAMEHAIVPYMSKERGKDRSPSLDHVDVHEWRKSR